jgi:hypothetical protein
MMNKAVKRRKSQIAVFGMNNLLQKRDPDKSLSHPRERARRRWHPTPSESGSATIVWSSTDPDAGQSDSVAEVHQESQFTGVDPDNK